MGGSVATCQTINLWQCLFCHQDGSSKGLVGRNEV